MTTERFKAEYGELVRGIVQKHYKTMSMHEIGRKYGMDHSNIRNILAGKSMSVRTIRRILLKEGVEMIESI